MSERVTNKSPQLAKSPSNTPSEYHTPLPLKPSASSNQQSNNVTPKTGKSSHFTNEQQKIQPNSSKSDVMVNPLLSANVKQGVTIDPSTSPSKSPPKAEQNTEATQKDNPEQLAAKVEPKSPEERKTDNVAAKDDLTSSDEMFVSQPGSLSAIPKHLLQARDSQFNPKVCSLKSGSTNCKLNQLF